MKLHDSIKRAVFSVVFMVSLFVLPASADPLTEKRALAAAGDAKSQYEMGWFYEHGKLVTADKVQSRVWCTSAAEQGYPPAENALGELYRDDIDLEPNRNKAVSFFRRAALQDNTKTLINLGDLYANEARKL